MEDEKFTAANLATHAAKGLSVIGSVGAAIASPEFKPLFAFISAAGSSLNFFTPMAFSDKPVIATVIENLNEGGDERLREILNKIACQAEKIQEFELRLQTQEAQAASFSARLHALRTSDPKKHRRLGAMTIQSIYENDLNPENLDDMMRAAVEIGESEIRFLHELYEWGKPMGMDGGADTSPRMGSVARLQAVAHVQLRTPGLDMGANIVVLMPRGRQFYERLQGLGRKI